MKKFNIFIWAMALMAVILVEVHHAEQTSKMAERIAKLEAIEAAKWQGIQAATPVELDTALESKTELYRYLLRDMREEQNGGYIDE